MPNIQSRPPSFIKIRTMQSDIEEMRSSGGHISGAKILGKRLEEIEKEQPEELPIEKEQEISPEIIKKADEDSIDLLFHTIATPVPKYIDKFHNLSVLLLLFTAVLLGCGLFLGKSNQTSINLFIHYGVCVSFVLGLISAFGADLFHYIDCKIKVISILKKHPVNLEHEHNSKY